MMFPKTKHKKRKATEPEKAVQHKVEAILDDLGLQYVHVPGSMQMYLRTRAPAWIAKIASDAFKGMPDLLIFSAYKDYNICLLLELKTEAGTISQSQKSWNKGLNLHVAYGYDEAVEIINDFTKYLDDM